MISRSDDPDLIGEFECEGGFVTRGRKRVFIMGKTHDSMKNVHAHDHQKRVGQAASGGIDQDAAGATIDAMRAMHKAGKTKIVFMRTGEVIDDNGLSAFEATLRVVPIAD